VSVEDGSGSEVVEGSPVEAVGGGGSGGSGASGGGGSRPIENCFSWPISAMNRVHVALVLSGQ
jgi:hypothetical protein